MKKLFFITKTIPKFNGIGQISLKEQSKIFWDSDQLELIRIDSRIKNSSCHMYSIGNDNNVRGIMLWVFGH